MSISKEPLRAAHFTPGCHFYAPAPNAQVSRRDVSGNAPAESICEGWPPVGVVGSATSNRKAFAPPRYLSRTMFADTRSSNLERHA